jgi:Fe2+ transport system protein B
VKLFGTSIAGWCVCIAKWCVFWFCVSFSFPETAVSQIVVMFVAGMSMAMLSRLEQEIEREP